MPDKGGAEIVADFKRFTGKNTLRFEIAKAALERPEEPVLSVVYPIAKRTNPPISSYM